MPHDVAWQLAESIQITHDGEGGHLGTVSARPHSTGWFISARSRSDLTPHEAEHFREFVSLRVYLLLTQGAQPQVWEPQEDGSWITRPAEELHELEESKLVPDTVPAAWS
jgi:hypothetical protein